MIWTDSSFAIEWLANSKKVQKIQINKQSLLILDIQYAETYRYLLKRGANPIEISRQLEVISLHYPTKSSLQLAAILYLQARKNKSKTSLADAILASMAKETKADILSFDQDFKLLGFKEIKAGHWSAFYK